MQGVYFLKTYDELSKSVTFGEKLRYFTDQNGTMGGPQENEFWVFWNSEMNATNSAEKVDEKNRVDCLVFMFPSWVMVLKLPKKVHFLQIWADLSRKSKPVKASLSENGVVYYALTYCFEDIRVWSSRILLNFCWVSIFWIFYFLISHEWWLRPL